MGNGMPYHLEKGPIWSVAESVMNSSETERASILEMLRNGTPLTDKALGKTLTSHSLQEKALGWPVELAGHGEKHWFGGTYDAKGVLQQQPWSDDPYNPTTTGYFQNYWGDVEAILRKTFIRAIEVSFGLAHDQPVDERRFFWPIEYFWKCPCGWVEGWVTWRSDPGQQNGHVTVHILTPSHGQPVLSSPLAGRGPTVDPELGTAEHGMWVITHERHDKYVAFTVDRSEFAIWPFPTLGPIFKAEGEVVTVSPSEHDGGVGPRGRAFQAPVVAHR